MLNYYYLPPEGGYGGNNGGGSGGGSGGSGSGSGSGGNGGGNSVSQPTNINAPNENPQHPGVEDWEEMNDNERVGHILKAMQYAKAVRIAVNLDHYFDNIPVTRNWGLGGWHAMYATVSYNGTVIPIYMVVPIHPSFRIFHMEPLAESGSYENEEYGSTYLYGFGFQGSNQNLLHIYVPVNYDDEFIDDFGL